MRLIDADDFKKKYCEENCGKRKCVDAMDKCNFILSLEEQPTAYDVEKVAEKLEDLEPFHVDGYGDDFVNLYDAIEIVKQGGIGTDDVCEWKYPKEIMDNTEFEVSCNSRPLKRGIVPNNFSFYDFKYCPYCGKKIKVVE